MSNVRTFAIVATILAGVATRLFPDTLNLTAVGAVCLFSGVYLKRNWLAVLLPLAAYFVSDLIVNALFYAGQFRWSFNGTTYLLFGLTVLMGAVIRQRPTVLRIATAGTLSAALFYVVSNFMVWTGDVTYPRTVAGLVECYIAAIPFAGNMLLGNLLYSAVIFGAWHYADQAFPKPVEKPSAAVVSAS
jgi:hypothetical protein